MIKKILNRKNVLFVIGTLLLSLVFVFPVLADDTGTAGHSVYLPNPLGTTNTLPDLLLKLIDVFLNIAGIAAVIYLVYGGLLFVKAQGKPEDLKTAKSNLLWAVIGLGVIFGAKAIATIVQSTINQLN